MSDSTWYSRESEAESLAAQLRTQRLTLLYGAPRSGKTTLLMAGVLPLLHRRATDAFGAAGGSGGVVLPFPDRRNTDESDAASKSLPEGARQAEPGAEVAVFFDRWDDAPLEGLTELMREALDIPHFDAARRRRSLASTLGSFHRQRGGKSLIVFDRFEELLIKPESDAGARLFAEAFIDAMNRPGLPVHFLIAMNEDAAPLLDRFRGRIAGLDDHCMRLPPLHPHGSGVPVGAPSLHQVSRDYRPPIDLELPSGGTPGGREAGAPTGPAPRVDASSPAHATQPEHDPEFAASRQADWVESAFGSPNEHMKTEDVYASMEALLGKITQAGGLDDLPHPPPAPRTPASPPPTGEGKSPGEPLPPLTRARAAASVRGGTAAVGPKPVTVGPAAVPAPEAVVPARAEASKAGRAASGGRAQGPSAAQPKAPVSAQHEASGRAVPVSTEGVEVRAGGAMAPAVAAAAAMEASGDRARDPDSADWLSEVHASLTKLSTRGDVDHSDDDAPILHHHADISPGDQRSSGRGTAVAVIVVGALILIVALLIGSTYLPPEYRPFELPEPIARLLSELGTQR